MCSIFYCDVNEAVTSLVQITAVYLTVKSVIFINNNVKRLFYYKEYNEQIDCLLDKNIRNKKDLNKLYEHIYSIEFDILNDKYLDDDDKHSLDRQLNKQIKYIRKIFYTKIRNFNTA